MFKQLHLWIVCACSISQSCPTLCNSMGCSLGGSSVHGHLQVLLVLFSMNSSLSLYLNHPLITATQMHFPSLNSHVAQDVYHVLSFYGFLKIFYLSVPVLSCGTRDLQSSLEHVGSVVVACELLFVACGIQFSGSCIENTES